MISFVTQDWIIENIDTVLFDKDGTFIDLHSFWGKMTELRASAVIDFYNINPQYFNKICQYLGYDINSKKMLKDGITALYSRSKIVQIFASCLLDLGVYATKEEITQIFDDVSEFFNRDIENYIVPIETAISFIKELKELGLKVGIVTSDSIVSTNLAIEHHSWQNLFDVVIARESCEATKESGIPTKLALEKLNASPENTLMIGDAPMDYISAKNAGVNNVILVATGQLEVEDLNETCSNVVEDLSKLLIYSK